MSVNEGKLLIAFFGGAVGAPENPRLTILATTVKMNNGQFSNVKCANIPLMHSTMCMLSVVFI